MQLRIRLLGTTTVLIDGEPQPVGGRRRRAVLARLALVPGVAVSADQLLTDVWGDDLPSGGPKAVAFQISKLRDVLEPERSGPGSVITTDAAGYRLRVEAGVVDVHQLEELVAGARASLDRPGEALALAEAALGLWRGDAFADIDDQPWVAGAVRRLDGLRLLAERTRIAARMAAGDELAVIGDLEQLVGLHPLEEGLVADLMTAYRATGRVADGLGVYGDLRRRLGDELGIEPSNELQRLEHQLLAGEAVSKQVRTARVADNLPVGATSFVGRDEELRRLDELIDRASPVVLTGPGGTGKTRLAIEYGRGVRDAFSDGVWLIELAPVSDPGLVMTAIGAVFGLRPGEGATISQVVGNYLRSRELLLVIDNCEHVVAAAADAVIEIGRAAPTVRIIATSRESLGVPGEVLVDVPSLELSGDDDGLGSAARLFIDRAQAVRPDAIRSEEHGTISRICRRVDGIPLGLELAAARLRMLSLTELADQLDESLRVLSGSPKRGPERHRTLRGTVSWSHSLLNAGEQKLFRRLSVFPTFFDVDAVTAVGLDEGDGDRWELLDRLDSLIDKSLVTVTTIDGEHTRYRLLVPVREYASEQLADADERDATRLRHARHYAALVAEAAPGLRGPAQFEWSHRLDAELANIRLTLDTLLSNGITDEALRTTIDLFVYWMHSGLHIEATETLLAGLRPESDAPAPLRVHAYWTLAILSAEVSDPRSADHARAGLELARTTGDQRLVGRMELSAGLAFAMARVAPEGGFVAEGRAHVAEARRLLDAHPEAVWWDGAWEWGLLHLLFGWATAGQPGPRTADSFEQACCLFEESGDVALQATALSSSVWIADLIGTDRALANGRRALGLLETVDAPFLRGHGLLQLGMVELTTDQSADGAGHLAAAADYMADFGDLHRWATATGRLADCEIRLGDLGGACRHISEVIDTFPIMPLPEMQHARALDTASHLLLRMDRLEPAALVLGRAAVQPFPVPFMRREPLHALLRAELIKSLGAERVDDLAEQGASLELHQTFDLARAEFSRFDH